MTALPAMTEGFRAAIVARYQEDHDLRVRDLAKDMGIAASTFYKVIREAGVDLRNPKDGRPSTAEQIPGFTPVMSRAWARPGARFSHPDRPRVEGWFREQGLVPTGSNCWSSDDGRIGSLQYVMDTWNGWISG